MHRNQDQEKMSSATQNTRHFWLTYAISVDSGTHHNLATIRMHLSWTGTGGDHLSPEHECSVFVCTKGTSSCESTLETRKVEDYEMDNRGIYEIMAVTEREKVKCFS